MKEFKETVGEIIKNDKKLLVAMGFLALLALILMIFSLVNLKPDASVVKVGYGDIGRYQGGDWSSMANSGGYQDGGWMNMLTYPILALVLGVLHNIIAVLLYRRKGEGAAKMFVVASIILVIGTWVVLRRLLGEG